MSLKIIVFLFYHVTYCLASGGLIVEGDLAPEGSFQYSVSIELYCYQNDEWTAWICGGSVIAQRVVLSAAHCLDPCTKLRTIMKVGNVDTTKAKTMLYSHHKTHDRFQFENLKNDICLIFLRGYIVFGDVKKVALLKHPPDGEAYVAGWGRRNENQSTKEACLRFMKQTIIRSKLCKHIIFDLRKENFCAMTNETEKGHAALGDSGAALIVQDYIQIGLVSYRRANFSSITVYTYVPYYLTWIKKYVNLLHCPD